MSTASSLTIDEMPSPIKPREDHHNALSSPEQVHTPRPPPSPLETEIDSDQGGPSSVEAQADPNDLSFDLDLDLPTSSYPLVSPQPSTSANDDILPCGPVNENEPNPFVDLFTPVNGVLILTLIYFRQGANYVWIDFWGLEGTILFVKIEIYKFTDLSLIM